MKIAALLLTPLAWGQIERPLIGHIRDRGGLVRPILGVSGNFMSGDATAGGVIAAAFNGRVGFLKFERRLAVIGRDGRELASFEAPEGPAQFSGALVYYPSTRELLRWRDGEMVALTLATFEDDVVAIEQGAEPRLIVRRETGLWRMNCRGELLERLPDVDGPLVALGDGRLLYATAEELVLTGAEERRLPMAGVEALAELGEGWIHVHAPGRHYALRLATLDFYLLPLEDR